MPGTRCREPEVWDPCSKLTDLKLKLQGRTRRREHKGSGAVPYCGTCHYGGTHDSVPNRSIMNVIFLSSICPYVDNRSSAFSIWAYEAQLQLSESTQPLYSIDIQAANM
jgi:hypothetical protein